MRDKMQYHKGNVKIDFDIKRQNKTLSMSQLTTNLNTNEMELQIFDDNSFEMISFVL